MCVGLECECISSNAYIQTSVARVDRDYLITLASALNSVNEVALLLLNCYHRADQDFSLKAGKYIGTYGYKEP